MYTPKIYVPVYTLLSAQAHFCQRKSDFSLTKTCTLLPWSHILKPDRVHVFAPVHTFVSAFFRDHVWSGSGVVTKKCGKKIPNYLICRAGSGRGFLKTAKSMNRIVF